MGKQHVVTSAREFALRVHEGSELGGEPFSVHLDEVAVFVRSFGDVHQTVAYLHHVLQVDGTTIEDVEASFGAVVAGCVALLSGLPGEDVKATRQRTYAALEGIGAGDERVVALVVGVADRLADVQNCFLNEDRGRLRKYRRDHRAFRAAVFRPGIADELWAELGDLMAS